MLSLPFELRYRLAWDHALCRAVLAVYTRTLLGFYRKRAKASGHRDCRTGTVTVIQRFGGALNLNVHFHTLALDGVSKDAVARWAAVSTSTAVETIQEAIRAEKPEPATSSPSSHLSPSSPSRSCSPRE